MDVVTSPRSNQGPPGTVALSYHPVFIQAYLQVIITDFVDLAEP